MTDPKSLIPLTKKLMADPIKLQRLVDRIYVLLKEDVKNQTERNGYSRGRL